LRFTNTFLSFYNEQRITVELYVTVFKLFQQAT